MQQFGRRRFSGGGVCDFWVWGGRRQQRVKQQEPSLLLSGERKRENEWGDKVVGRWRAASSRAPLPPAVEGHRGQQAVSPERLGSGIGRRSSRNLWFCSTRTGHRQGRGLPASAYGVEKKGGLECFRDSHYNRAPTTWGGEVTNNGFFFGIFIEDWNLCGKVVGGDETDFFFVNYTKDVGSAFAGFPAMRPPGRPARWPLLSVDNGSNRTRCSGEVPVGEARMRARLPMAPPTPTQCVPTR